MTSKEKLHIDIGVHYIYKRELSIKELKINNKILPGIIEVIYHKPTKIKEGTMNVTNLNSNKPGHEYGIHLMIKAVKDAKKRGINNIILDDFSDRYRCDHNIYTKLGLKYEDPDGGPEMVGLVDDILKYKTKTEQPKIWTLIIH